MHSGIPESFDVPYDTLCSDFLILLGIEKVGDIIHHSYQLHTIHNSPF
jgi:hypothetical protein